MQTKLLKSTRPAKTEAAVKTLLASASRQSVTALKRIVVAKRIARLNTLDIAACWPAESADGIYREAAGTLFPDPDLTPDDLPVYPGGRARVHGTVEGESLAQGLAMCACAQSGDISRDMLRGTLLEIATDKLTLVATDGRRLHRVEMPAAFNKKGSAVIPEEAVKLMRRVWRSGPMTVKIFSFEKAEYIEFAGRDGIRLTVKTKEGIYPNYKLVIPAGSDIDVSIDPRAWLDVLRGLEPEFKLYRDHYGVDAPVRLTFDRDGGLMLELPGEIPGVGTASRKIDGCGILKWEAFEEVTGPDNAKTKRSVDSWRISVNTQFLAEALACDMRRLALGDSMTPLVLTGEDRMAIIMPIREL